MLATASSSQTMARIEFLRRVPLLKHLTNEQVSKLAGALASQTFADGDAIIRQGERGNAFFLVKDGTVKCTQTKQDREVELLTLGTGDYFGEMALLLDEPRHANVMAVGPVEVLSLEKEDFAKLLGPVREVLSHQMRTRVLKSVLLLSRLSDADLDQVGNAMRVQQFEPNQYIVKEGEPGSRFYIINEGVVKCCKASAVDPGVEEEMLRLHDQEYFGERALLKEEPRAASVVAVTRVECLVLERSDFTGLLGDLEEIMVQEVKRREDMRQQVQQAQQQQLQHKSGGGPDGEAAAATGAGAVLPHAHLKMEDLNVVRVCLSNGPLCGKRFDVNMHLKILNTREIVFHERVQQFARQWLHKNSLSFLTQLFVQLRTLGTGTFGRVKLVQYLATVSSETPVLSQIVDASMRVRV